MSEWPEGLAVFGFEGVEGGADEREGLSVEWGFVEEVED